MPNKGIIHKNCKKKKTNKQTNKQTNKDKEVRKLSARGSICQ
jgi:hypothetical protein